MSDFEKSYYLEKERLHAREQNEADLARLRSQADDMKQELQEGKLSEAAANDLTEQLKQTRQAIGIIRESIRALTKHDVLMVEDAAQPLTVEITDLRAYWVNEYNTKCRELSDLLKEYESYKNAPPSEALASKIARLELDIDRVEQAAEQALENFETLEE